MEKVQIIKQEKGITLIILAVTVIVLGILSVTAIYNGTAGLDTAKKQVFISEMQMIQARVNTIYEKRKMSTSDKEYYDSIGRDVSNLDQTKVEQALAGSSSEGFKYYTPEDLEKLDLANMTRTVLINYDTRQVICYEPVVIEGQGYYKLQDISNNIGRNIEQDIPENTSEPSFTLEQTKIENTKWRITLKNVQYSSSNVGLASVSYKLSSSTAWIITNTLDFEVTSAGNYDVKLTDTAGKERIITGYAVK